MNVHLFRHFAVKLVLDADPGDIETARRLLGHTSSATTSKAYAEFKTIAAFRRYDAVISAHRTTSGNEAASTRGRGARR